MTARWNPSPRTCPGARVGYARVSTKGQLLDRQIAALNVANCVRVFADKKSGKNAEREELWKSLGVEVSPSLTCDRAGDVGGAYAQGVRIEGRLTGCGWPVQHANISVAGDLFLCCNDYYQREVFGNIRDGSIDELMTSHAAVSLRQRVFGVAEAPEDFLCRCCHNQTLDFPGRDFRPIATFG
ncbi:SPASM domain-containing protein [Streptomyces lydicus]|uniref:SPASM domain-containing protein n=1 Tax=Streptomyces lydicus TaxID=47763 RepID=UPI00378F8528